MPKPYELRLYTGVAEAQANGTDQKFVISLTRYAQNWRRSIRRMGGFWQGSFSISGDARQLQQAFETWLGYHVEERASGVVSWEGMAYEMDLTLTGVRRRRSLDMVWNAAKASYTDSTWSVDNCMNNADYEAAGTGGENHIFAGWRDVWGDAPGNVATAVGYGGLGNCCAITSNGANGVGLGSNPAYIRQHVNVTPGGRYKLRFRTKTDASKFPLFFRVRDPNASEDVVALQSTGWASTTWTDDTRRITREFIGPADGEVLIMFYGHCSDPANSVGMGTIAYADDVELYEWRPSVFELPYVPDGVQEQSINRYGRREQIIQMDEYPLATSQARRGTYLAENAWPWPRPVSTGMPGEATLEIQCAGYCHTLNWQHVMAGDGATHNASDWIAAIAGTEFGISWRHNGHVTGAGDCQFVKCSLPPLGTVKENTLQVTQLTGVEERPWDVLLELALLGGVSGTDYVPWRVYVSEGRLLNYRPLWLQPVYYIRPDGIVTTLGAATPANPWNVRPATFRDMGYRAGYEERGSFLANSQYFYADEVEMADGWSQPNLRTSAITESDLLEAQLQNVTEPASPADPYGQAWR